MIQDEEGNDREGPEMGGGAGGIELARVQQTHLHKEGQHDSRNSCHSSQIAFRSLDLGVGVLVFIKRVT